MRLAPFCLVSLAVPRGGGSHSSESGESASTATPAGSHSYCERRIGDTYASLYIQGELKRIETKV